MPETITRKPHSFCKFWWLCIKEAWSESREKFGLLVDILLFIAAILLVLFVRYSRNHSQFNADKENGAVSYWFAVIPAGLWILWFLYHVPKASYKMYREQFNKTGAEIEQKESRFHELSCEVQKFKEQTSPLLIGFKISPQPNRLQTSCTIILSNPSQTQALDGVELALVSIVPPMPHADKAGFSTDNITLMAVDFVTVGMKDKKLTGSQSAHFPAFVVFETAQSTKLFFQFAGAIPTEDEYLWKSANHFSPLVGVEYIFTFHGRARGLMQAEKQFKLRVFSKGFEPQITFL